MKKLLIIYAVVIFANNLFSQCKSYIATIAPEQIKPYVIDGTFYAPVVYEGDKIVYTRAFLKGNRYIIKLVGFDILEKKIKILDEDGFLLFTNYRLNKKVEDKYFIDYQGNKVMWMGTNYFEFTPERSQNIKIVVKLERKAKRKKYRIQGCLGIVVGYLPKTNDMQTR